MINRLSFPSQNLHIAALKRAFAQALQPIQCLAIAHREPRLVKSLSTTLAGHSTAVLEVSQDTWDFNSHEFTETVEWAFRNGDIRMIVLAGSSQSGGAASRASLVAAKPQVRQESGYARLLAGVQRHHARIAEVQEEFAGHIQRLSHLPIVHSRWIRNQLAVCGLFYRAETGVFLRFEAETETFELMEA